jgi:hypothetical protein
MASREEEAQAWHEHAARADHDLDVREENVVEQWRLLRGGVPQTPPSTEQRIQHRIAQITEAASVAAAAELADQTRAVAAQQLLLSGGAPPRLQPIPLQPPAAPAAAPAAPPYKAAPKSAVVPLASSEKRAYVLALGLLALMCWLLCVGSYVLALMCWLLACWLLACWLLACWLLACWLLACWLLACWLFAFMCWLLCVANSGPRGPADGALPEVGECSVLFGDWACRVLECPAAGAPAGGAAAAARG